MNQANLLSFGTSFSGKQNEKAKSMFKAKDETKTLGQSQLSSGFIPNQAIISRKAKIIASRGPSLRSGPRKKIFSRRRNGEGSLSTPLRLQ